jgi:hypothetical protein
MPKCHTNFKDGIEVVGPTTFQGYDGLGLSSVIAKKYLHLCYFELWWINTFYIKIHLLKNPIDKVAKRKMTYHKSSTEIKTHRERVWQDTKPNSLGISHVHKPKYYGSKKILDSILLGSAMCQAQSHMSLVRCQTQFSWTWLRAELKCI